MVEYESNGSGRETAFKGFVYPSIYGRYNTTIQGNGETKSVGRENRKREDF
jgi:hypothetical protein